MKEKYNIFEFFIYMQWILTRSHKKQAFEDIKITLLVKN